MERIEAINSLLPELNDIGEQLAKAYRNLNAGDDSWIKLQMDTIKLRADTILSRLERRDW